LKCSKEAEAVLGDIRCQLRRISLQAVGIDTQSVEVAQTFRNKGDTKIKVRSETGIIFEMPWCTGGALLYE